tara:strand:+ start:230 stop:496 length:267 start_codon:yes stop_codon:yes gene_type:complete
MPIIQSAFRRVKRSEAQSAVNKIRKSKYKAAVKQMTAYIASGKTKEAISFLPKFHSQLMKIAKTGVISKKRASRKISRLEKKIQKLKK